MKRVMVLVALLTVVACAQEQRTMEITAGAPGPAQPPAPKKMSPEQRKQGRTWMELAEAQAKGLEGGMRAYALLQVAKSLEPEQKKHTVELLEDALAASKAVEDDEMHTRSRLEQQILRTMVRLAPRRADELLPQLDPVGRESVLRALLAYYRESKQTDRAIEMVYRIAAEKEFPYGAGAELMREMPAEKQGELQQMFVTALSSYREHKHPGVTVGSGDFPGMIMAFYKQLAPDLVKEAVFEVLKQAKAPEDEGRPRQPEPITIASGQGSAAMGSMYDYRLFQLLPALRAVDADEAERLLKQNREVAGMLEKYPQGAEQLSGQPGRERSRTGAMYMVGGGPGPGGAGMPDRAQMERLQQIVTDAQSHPEDALANVATLASPQLKVEALQAVAQTSWKKSGSVARSALKQMLELVPQLDPPAQVLPVRTAVTLYLEMGEAAEAKKAVEKGLESAGKLYKQDTDADDPNKALKAYWPSASAYTGLLRVAAEMDPGWAQEQLKEVPDEEIRAVAQAAMAAALLGQPPGPVTIMSEKKDGTNMMQMNVD